MDNKGDLSFLKNIHEIPILNDQDLGVVKEKNIFGQETVDNNIIVLGTDNKTVVGVAKSKEEVQQMYPESVISQVTLEAQKISKQKELERMLQEAEANKMSEQGSRLDNLGSQIGSEIALVMTDPDMNRKWRDACVRLQAGR